MKAEFLFKLKGLDFDPSIDHSVVGSARWWRVDASGIYIDGATKPCRTLGPPITIRRINTEFGQFLDKSPMLAALIATESCGSPGAERHETSAHDWSFGLCQVLTHTAVALAAKHPHLPHHPAPLVDDTDASLVAEWKTFFRVPEHSIAYAKAYLEGSKGITDPILLYAIYNAGGVYKSEQYPWCLRVATPTTLDRFAALYGDACEVFK